MSSVQAISLSFVIVNDNNFKTIATFLLKRLHGFYKILLSTMTCGRTAQSVVICGEGSSG